MGITSAIRTCCLLAAMVVVCLPAMAQTTTAPFDDAEAQLRIRQAATAASAAARESDTLRKALEAERGRVVQTDGERDLNQAAIRALEKDLQAAEAKQREQEATLKRLRRRGNSVALEPANPTYETRIFPPDRVKVQGKLVGIFRRY